MEEQMNPPTTLSPGAIRDILHQNHSPRLVVGPDASKFVIAIKSPNGWPRRVSWSAMYVLTADTAATPLSLREAAACGYPIVTGRDIYQALLTPEQFALARSVSEIDDRTAMMIESASSRIGYTHLEEATYPDRLIQLGPSPLVLPVHPFPTTQVGLSTRGEWVVQWTDNLRVGDQFTTRLYFVRCPSQHDLDIAVLILSIKTILAQKGFRPDFHCLNCGRHVSHWLDAYPPDRPMTLGEKWTAFLDRTCGCDRAPTVEEDKA